MGIRRFSYILHSSIIKYYGSKLLSFCYLTRDCGITGSTSSRCCDRISAQRCVITKDVKSSIYVCYVRCATKIVLAKKQVQLTDRTSRQRHVFEIWLHVRKKKIILTLQGLCTVQKYVFMRKISFCPDSVNGKTP